MPPRRRHKSRDIPLKKENQEYAYVTQRMGDCRYILSCQDRTKRMGHLRGNMRNRVYVREGDFVLISFRPGYSKFSMIQSKGSKLEYCDIILKYFDKEVTFLKSNGHLRNLEDDENNEQRIESTQIEDTEFDALIQQADSNIKEESSHEIMGINTDEIDI
tara:strand:+ start:63 stop:542 length:480 start_codon:yes stop_codon:yes gene_type:complete